MSQTREQDVAEAIAELDRVRSQWLSRRGVTAVDVGFLTKGGKLTDDVGIRVMVRKKLSPDEVPPGEMFPPTLGRFSVQITESTLAPE